MALLKSAENFGSLKIVVVGQATNNGGDFLGASKIVVAGQATNNGGRIFGDRLFVNNLTSLRRTIHRQTIGGQATRFHYHNAISNNQNSQC